MASLELKIQPFEVPRQVYVQVPGQGEVPVELSELDAATLENMIEEFAAAVMSATEKA